MLYEYKWCFGKILQYVKLMQQLYEKDTIIVPIFQVGNSV